MSLKLMLKTVGMSHRAKTQNSVIEHHHCLTSTKLYYLVIRA